MVTKPEKKLGDSGYVNQNCWLAKNVNYPPSKRCQYCESKFRNCLFERYLIITLILVSVILIGSYLFEKNISRSLIFSIFALVITYGYFFNKTTQKMIESHFEEKKAKDAFIDLSGNLQKKVDDQTKDIKKSYEIEKTAKEELESLGQSKDQFMMTIQHHLRTPLTVMKGCIDLILDGSCGKQNKKTMEVIARFKKSTDNLIKMVNEFLDITQFEMGRQVINKKTGVSIISILEDILEELKPEALKKEIYLEMENKDDFIINADSEKIKAALYNIIDNAVKYTQKGGVKVKLEAGDSLSARVILQDTGIGMNKDDINSLFNQIFERGQEAQKAFATGRGMGLFISKQIIKAHGGKIWAESRGEGKGSTFYVELPIV